MGSVLSTLRVPHSSCRSLKRPAEMVAGPIDPKPFAARQVACGGGGKSPIIRPAVQFMNVRFWPKADIPSRTANVCFRG